MTQPHFLSRYWNRHLPTLLILGIASGLPILLIFGTLSIWLREAGIERSTITLLSWAGLTYGFKFIWAPLIDSIPIPWLSRLMGRRRSWMLIAQSIIILALILMSQIDPSVSRENLLLMAGSALLLGFASATQDIVIDAYRIEVSESEYQAILASVAVVGYRIGMLMAGVGALELSSFFGGDGYSFYGWQMAYLAMAAIMGLAILTTLLISEPKAAVQQNNLSRADQLILLCHFLWAALIFILLFTSYHSYWSPWNLASMPEPKGFERFVAEAIRLLLSLGAPVMIYWQLSRWNFIDRENIRQVYVAPIANFFQTYGQLALWLILIICCYRTADIVMGVIAKVFYIDMGYSKEQIGHISLGFGLLMTLLGGIIGGVFAIRFGLLPIFMLGAIVAPLSNLVFIYLAGLESPSTNALIAAIMVDNLSGGLAGSAAVAFISSLVNRQFSATQYASFTAITVLLPKLLAGYSGAIVDGVGYPIFFSITALMGLPVIFLIIKVWQPYLKIEQQLKN